MTDPDPLGLHHDRPHREPGHARPAKVTRMEPLLTGGVPPGAYQDFSAYVSAMLHAARRGAELASQERWLTLPKPRPLPERLAVAPDDFRPPVDDPDPWPMTTVRLRKYAKE